MARMKTFLMYALMIVGFIFLSLVLEDGLVDNMYKVVSGQIDKGAYGNVSINDIETRATNVNGYMNFKLKNESTNTLNCYATIDLYSKQGIKAATEYIEIFDFAPGEERNYEVKFKANEIASYDFSLVSEVPDRSSIIRFLGWEIDLSNVFGMDLTNLELFGVKLTDLFSWENVKTAGSNAWSWIRVFLASIPWWGYAIGAGIVLWYMPKGYLFGIFPF